MTRLKKKRYLKARYYTLKSRGHCVTCARRSNGGTRCINCRENHTNAQRYYRGVA